MNNLFGITDSSYLFLLKALSRYPEVDEVLIFGSRAKGNFKKGSDIDLAIKGKGCSEELAMNIKGYLNEEVSIPYYVDVVDYASLRNKDLREHIDHIGIKFI